MSATAKKATEETEPIVNVRISEFSKISDTDIDHSNF